MNHVTKNNNKYRHMKFKISLLSVLFFSMASGFSQNGLYNIADFGAINNEKILSTNAI